MSEQKQAPDPPTAQTSRTLADYRPQHDHGCAVNYCGHEWQTENGAGVCRMPAEFEIHYIGTPDNHPFVIRPCTCGLAALLSVRSTADQEPNHCCSGGSTMTQTVEQAIAELERIARELDTDYARAIQGEVKSVAGNWLAGLRSSIVALRSTADQGWQLPTSAKSHLDVESPLFERGQRPHIWIQWKGTDVCCDIHCVCGAHCHFDGDFFYEFQCPHCLRYWEVGTHVQLYEVTQAHFERSGCAQVVIPDDDMPLPAPPEDQP